MLTHQVLPTVNLLTDRLEDHNITFEDLLRLHQFGFMDVLPFRPYTIAGLRQELDKAFPEDVPTPRQINLYRLALEIINNRADHLSTFFSPRIYRYWIDPSRLDDDSIVAWHLYLQGSNPSKRQPHPYSPDYSKLFPDSIVEPRPRLIDRINTISDAEAATYLSFIQDLLTDLQYFTICQHCFEKKTFASIAQLRNCSGSNTAAAYHAAIRRLRWRASKSNSLKNIVFGEDAIGTICDPTQ